MNLEKIFSANLDKKGDKNTDSYLLLFAQTDLLALKLDSSNLDKKGDKNSI